MILYNSLLITQFGLALIVFITLFFYSAPYGRYIKKNPLSLPPRLGWMLMEFPAFATILVCFIIGKGYLNPLFLVFILIWEVHYVQRTFIYPALMDPGVSRVPVFIMLNGILFNLINGYINGYGLFIRESSAVRYGTAWLFDLRFIAGTILFFVGFFINVQSDRILRKLKKRSPGTYSIPYSGLHRFVSNPNYFGELLEWGGWALLTWSLPGLAFFLFTAANLAPRAWNNRKWYREKFGRDYPEKRKAIIPFLF